jgi:signal transduction histidine kinase
METLKILDKKQGLDWNYDEEADVVYVSFRTPQGATDSEMRDDGVGFEPDAVAGGGRRGRQPQGLANIRRRAELLDAQLAITSVPGQGTALSLTMPVATTRRHP